MACNASYMFTVFRKEIFVKKWPLILKQLTTDETVNPQATNSSGFLPNKAGQPKSNQADTN